MKSRIDWQSVYARLERSRAATEQALAPDARRVEEVYCRRAARLAQPPASRDGSGAELNVLVFRLGAGRYALELSQLAAVISQPLCAPVPGAPPQLAGVLQTRGELRPVWRLARVLGLAESEPPRSPVVLLARRGGREFGLLVDQVEGIRTIAREDCRPALEDSPHVRCLTADLTIVLSLDELLKEEV